MTEITLDPQTKKFLPGNIWRYKPGQSGKPARYNYKTMRLKVIDYAVQQAQDDVRCTWAGLAAYLGMTRRGLDMYREGTVGKDKDAVVHLLGYYATLMEAQLEQWLTDRHHATAGVIRALEVCDPDRWVQSTKVDISVTQQIQVVLPTGGKLRQRMINAGVDVPALPAPTDT